MKILKTSFSANAQELTKDEEKEDAERQIKKEIRIHQETNGMSPGSVEKILNNIDVDQLVGMVFSWAFD